MLYNIYIGKRKTPGETGGSPTSKGEREAQVRSATKNKRLLKRLKKMPSLLSADGQPIIKYNRILTMITATFDLDIDQQRSEKQADIALGLFISGEGDGFDGIYPASLDLAYINGYCQGLRRKMANIQYQAEMLEAEGLAVEAIFGEEIPF